MTVSTPPSTTLSTPSPTERSNPLDFKEHDMSSRPIYLIVATSKSSSRLGIGFRNSLPWPPIKADMAFFQKVTRDSRPQSAPAAGFINAVVMGRKTYESIPARFRPLSGRLNVVISRTSPQDLSEKLRQGLLADKQKPEEPELQIESHALPASQTGEASSIVLSGRKPSATTISASTKPAFAPILCSSSLPSALSAVASPSLATKLDKQIGNIFIIGGAEIYSSVLQHPSGDPQQPVRILQTQVRKLDGSEFECDTFFPMPLDAGNNQRGRVSNVAVQAWLNSPTNDGTGVEVPQGDGEWARDDKVGVELRVLGWEMVAS